MIVIRRTQHADWTSLKAVRLAALLDSPTAFGIRYEQSAAQTDAQWQDRAAGSQPAFWLAFADDEPVGMIGGDVATSGRYNLIAMWVPAPHRGSGAACRLVEAVKSHALGLGHDSIYLDVSPDNARAARFYQKQGFSFIDEWEPLASHPHIRVQTMLWRRGA